MVKLLRASGRPFSRDWVAEQRTYIESVFQDKPAIFVRNAWIPEPPGWIQRAHIIQLLYLNKILTLQSCGGLPVAFANKRRISESVAAGKENSNRFQRSAANVNTPRGIRRSQFEPDMRNKVEG